MQNVGDIWDYRRESGFDTDTSDLAGYSVEALDGSIGKIDEATDEAWLAVPGFA